MNGLYSLHVERLSSNPRVLGFAQSINSYFLSTGLTELPKLDPEYEAIVLQDARGDIGAITVFYRYEEHDDEPAYYLVIVWTAQERRGQGCYRWMLEWLKDYATKKDVHRLVTDVHYDNAGMIKLKEQHWRKTFVRFNLEI